MFELLIRELKRQDAIDQVIDKVKTFPSGFNRAKYKHMAGYEHFLKQTGISFEWRVEPNTKKLEHKDLTGPEKLRVIQNISFQALLPNFEHHKELKKLWNDFVEIIGDLKLDFPTDEPIAAHTAKIKSWFQQFLSLYQAKDVTVKNIFPVFHRFFIGKKNLFQSNKGKVIPLTVIVMLLIKFLAEFSSVSAPYSHLQSLLHTNFCLSLVVFPL